jgi:hypothetical protein
MHIRIGAPAAPEDDALPLLPSGPDGVRRASPRRTHPDTQTDYTKELHENAGRLKLPVGVSQRRMKSCKNRGCERYAHTPCLSLTHRQGWVYAFTGARSEVQLGQRVALMEMVDTQ